VDEALLDRLLDDDYFRAVPPKTTGRERYGRDYVARLAEGFRPGSDEAEWRDLIATLTALTARTLGEAYRTWVLPRGLDEVFLMGGGSRNPVLVEAIAAELAPIPVMDGGELGVDPDAREALAFAVLTWAHLHGVACNAPDATGARAAGLVSCAAFSAGL
jgi:anhydro-N-acetylmuramic acid kinase